MMAPANQVQIEEPLSNMPDLKRVENDYIALAISELVQAACAKVKNGTLFVVFFNVALWMLCVLYYFLILIICCNL